MTAYALSVIVGDDAWTLDRLKSLRIRQSAKLLDKAKGPKERKALSAATGLPESEVLDLANKADLMRIKWMGTAYIRLLRAVGVHTVRELRQRNPEKLFE